MNLTEGCCPEKDENDKQCWRQPDHHGPHLIAVEKAGGVWEWKTWPNKGAQA